MINGGGGVIVRGVVVGVGGVLGGVIVGVGGVVGRIFTLCWSRCPWAMTAARGGYLRTSADVILGKDARKPALIASHSVDSAG